MFRLIFIISTLVTSLVASAYAQQQQQAAVPDDRKAAIEVVSAASSAPGPLAAFYGKWEGTRLMPCSATPRKYEVTIRPGLTRTTAVLDYKTQKMCINGVDVTNISAEFKDGVLQFTGDTKFYDLKLQNDTLDLSVWHRGHQNRHTFYADGATLTRSK